MSVIALSSLAIGGVTSTSHVDAGNVPAQQQSRKYRDTILPSVSGKKLGVGIFAVALGVGVGTYVYNHRKPAKNTSTPQDEITFDKALEYIEKWHKYTQGEDATFPDKIVKAVDKIEKTFFPEGNPEPTDVYRTITSLKLFPHTVENCTQQNGEYFVPLSWNNGEETFDKEDSFMLHKVLFQYLCRMLCFVLSSDTSSTWSKEQHYVYYLEGKGPFDEYGYGQVPVYTRLFDYMVTHPEVCKEYQRVKSQVKALIITLASMYDNAGYSGTWLTKCGVFCGRTSRTIDN